MYNLGLVINLSGLLVSPLEKERPVMWKELRAAIRACQVLMRCLCQEPLNLFFMCMVGVAKQSNEFLSVKKTKGRHMGKHLKSTRGQESLLPSHEGQRHLSPPLGSSACLWTRLTLNVGRNHQGVLCAYHPTGEPGAHLPAMWHVAAFLVFHTQV